MNRGNGETVNRGICIRVLSPFLPLSVSPFHNYFFLLIKLHVGLFTVISMSLAKTGNPSNP